MWRNKVFRTLLFLPFALLFFTVGCVREQAAFTPTESVEPSTDESIKHIGQYTLANGGTSITIYVYHVTVNGRKREIHWNGRSSQSGCFGIMNLSLEE